MNKPKLYLINGPLGSGKTTVLLNLLGSSEFKNASVIENEFASLSIDTDQLHSHTDEIKTIAGICICCSTGEELTDTLKELSTSSEKVIIEATGIANSLKLVEKIVVADILEDYELAHTIFVLDSMELYSDTKGTIDKYRIELMAADTVLLSKLDLLKPIEKTIVINALLKLNLPHFEIALEGCFNTARLENKSNMLDYFSKFDGEIVDSSAESNYSIVDFSEININKDELDKLISTLQEKYVLKRVKGDFTDKNNKSWHVESTPFQTRIKSTSTTEFKIVFIGNNAKEINLSIVKENI